MLGHLRKEQHYTWNVFQAIAGILDTDFRVLSPYGPFSIGRRKEEM